MRYTFRAVEIKGWNPKCEASLSKATSKRWALKFERLIVSVKLNLNSLLFDRNRLTKPKPQSIVNAAVHCLYNPGHCGENNEKPARLRRKREKNLKDHENELLPLSQQVQNSDWKSERQSIAKKLWIGRFNWLKIWFISTEHLTVPANVTSIKIIPRRLKGRFSSRLEGASAVILLYLNGKQPCELVHNNHK